MELRQLRYLVAVVEERSISRAAERLTMTQPPLSTSISQLEKEIGVPLLRRHARGVEPTDAGSFLVQQVRRVLATLEEAAEATRAVGSGRLGRLTVATVTSATWQLLPGALAAFAHRSPDVDLEVVDTLPDDVVDRVRHRRATVGLVYCADTRTLGSSLAAGLETAVIRREPLVAVLPRNHPSAAASVVDLTALTEDRWVVPASRSAFSGLPELIHDAWTRAGLYPADQRSTATVETALPMVQAGLGVTVLPSSVTAVAGPRVRVAPLLQQVSPLEAALVWREEQPSPALAAFIAAVLATPEPDQLGTSHARHAPDVTGPEQLAPWTPWGQPTDRTDR